MTSREYCEMIGAMAADHYASLGGDQNGPDPEAPHEYMGMDVDIGVGVQWEPCHTCGQSKEDERHVVSTVPVGPDDEDAVPF